MTEGYPEAAQSFFSEARLSVETRNLHLSSDFDDQLNRASLANYESARLGISPVRVKQFEVMVVPPKGYIQVAVTLNTKVLRFITR